MNSGQWRLPFCRRNRIRAKEARAVDPSATDRGKQGTKRHIIVDRHGTPLALVLSGANVHDSKMLEAVVDAVPLVYSGRPGAPRCRPEKLHADKGYDFTACRQALRRRGILPRIARRGVDSSERLGRWRWVVERTLSWLNRFRRLRVRYERRDDIYPGFNLLACALVCLSRLLRTLF